MELKSAMTELKKLIQSFNNRPDQAEERILMSLKTEHLKLSREGGGGRMKRNEKLTGLLRHH